MLSQNLSEAGLASSDERSRCLYGLGTVQLIRFSRSGYPADLSQAITCLEQARAGLESVPGDPFLVPLLRALAWAYRQDAYRQEQAWTGTDGRTRTDTPRLPRHRSRSTARSVLYAHAQSVLLQSSTRHALAASRALRQDTLTLTEWCIADGRPDAAVEALELGRALVLHAATVAADIPALLRESGHPNLAAQWSDHIDVAQMPAGAAPQRRGPAAAGAHPRRPARPARPGGGRAAHRCRRPEAARRSLRDRYGRSAAGGRA